MLYQKEIPVRFDYLHRVRRNFADLSLHGIPGFPGGINRQVVFPGQYSGA